MQQLVPAVIAAPLTLGAAVSWSAAGRDLGEARGADVGGARVHSVRLPDFVVSTEVVFGLPDERPTIRHDAGGSPEPYVAGTLIAVRRAPALVGVTRGLDTLLLH